MSEIRQNIIKFIRKKYKTMKKLIPFVIVLSIAISMFAQTVNAESTVACESAGDVNVDDKINLADASLMLKHIANWSDLTIDLNRADVTNDDKVNLSDVSVVLKYIAGWDSISFGHVYSNYKCSNCGEIDKTHAYEYLVEWVKENGVVDGAYVNFDYYVTGSDEIRKYSLMYDANADDVSVWHSGFYADEYLGCAVYLDNYFYGMDFIDCRVIGYIDATNFTANSPITYSEYTGSESFKWDMIDLTRLYVNDLIDWLDWCLETNNVGITIQDLGFNSYVCS